MFYKVNFSYIFCIFCFLILYLFNFLKANTLNSNLIIDNSQDLNPTYRRYLVSAGDVLNINFVGIRIQWRLLCWTRWDDFFTRVKRGLCQDMTLDEIYLLLNKEYSRVLKNPNLFISIKKYRPCTNIYKGRG